MQHRLLIALLLVVMYGSASTICEAKPTVPEPIVSRPIVPGAGSFIFVDHTSEKVNELVVWYYCPEDFLPNGNVLFVMHGTKRNGDDYRDNWIELARTHKLLIIAPQFSKKEYPGNLCYQFGNVRRKNGSLRPKSEWSLTAIDRIFDHVVTKNHLEAKDYFIFGHSAGAQFVHRMILLYPEARVKMAISANAGSYTMPNNEVNYPYGLKESPGNDKTLKKSLQERMVVLLGEEDTDPNHRYLPRSPEAMDQGPHRFNRGHFFYNTARERAKELNVEFGWQLVTVPGVGHKNAKMAVAAAKLISLAK